ncbi:MAG: Holliday junction resolvase RuvX [Flavobacteriales bacterium]
MKIHRVNEMYTSKMAAQSMLTSGLKQSARRDKGTLDKMSAAILLQSWLDYHQG